MKKLTEIFLEALRKFDGTFLRWFGTVENRE